ncbi:MAG: FAD:protein FMN transferase [Candidatus Omnitrophota bacterium]
MSKSKIQNSKQRIFYLYFVLCALTFEFLCGCQNKQLYNERRIAMGTFVEVLSDRANAAGIVFKEIKRIEGLLSKYNPDSEVSLLNKAGMLKASPETFTVIKKAKEFWQESEGAFDITVAALMDLWGFTNREYVVLNQEQITESLKKVGSDKIALNETDNVIKFLDSGIKIDLGGIAKGFAVDCAVKKLKEAQVKSCLINAGGDVYCLGKKSGRAWRVAVQNPRHPGVINQFELNDQCAATSGNYEQYFTLGGKEYAHIINPKTGSPADSGLSSVTVIAPDCLTADALATTIFVLGKEKGEALAEKYPGVHVEFIEDETR